MTAVRGQALAGEAGRSREGGHEAARGYGQHLAAPIFSK